MDTDDFWAFAGEHLSQRELDALRVHFAATQNNDTHRSAAEAMGLSKNAYKLRVRRAKRKLYARRPVKSDPTPYRLEGEHERRS